jgi:predicted amidohydrolase YtcJ
LIDHADPDVVFLNGKVVTLDAGGTITSSVAVKKGKVVCAGSDEEMRKCAGSTARIIDLHGKTMIPGFVDSHTHLGPASLSFRHYLDGRCPPNRSVKEILERIEERALHIPPGEWIVMNMNVFTNLKLKEKRFPTREELNRVAPRHPVLILASAHTQIANSCALNLAKITGRTSDPPGGKIERDAGGKPNGILRECRRLLPIPPFTFEEIKESLRTMTQEYWVRQGFTTAYTFVDHVDLRALQELRAAKSLPLRIQAMLLDDLNKHEMLEGVINLGLKTGFGDEWLKIGGVKVYTDGAFKGLSAATYEPYLNMDAKDFCGLFRRDPATFNEVVLKAHKAGMLVCIHAIGDRAQDLALDSCEYVLRVEPKPHRLRIEHFGNIMTNPERIGRAQNMGIIPITTVEWLYAYGDFIELYLGKKWESQSFVLRSMFDAGLIPANGSDCRGAEPFSINPFFNIWCAVTRQTFLGKTLNPGEAISVKEALKLYTTNAAYSGFEEKVKGSIEPGKLADLIVIDRDILTIPENDIKDIRVVMSVIDGRIVYESGSAG